MSTRLRLAPNAILAAMLLLGGCHRASRHPYVVDAWVRLPAVAGQPAAAYFTLVGDQSDEKLVKVETAMARKAQLHASTTGPGGMMAMQMLPEVTVLARDKVAFAPGGYHVMLIGLDPAVKAGTAVPLRFGFASGATADVEAKTVNAGDPAPY